MNKFINKIKRMIMKNVSPRKITLLNILKRIMNFFKFKRTNLTFKFRIKIPRNLDRSKKVKIQIKNI
jgi:hypothetical protein